MDVLDNKKGVTIISNSLSFKVGVPGFEPGTPCSQSEMEQFVID